MSNKKRHSQKKTEIVDITPPTKVLPVVEEDAAKAPLSETTVIPVEVDEVSTVGDSSDAPPADEAPAPEVEEVPSFTAPEPTIIAADQEAPTVGVVLPDSMEHSDFQPENTVPPVSNQVLPVEEAPARGIRVGQFIWAAIVAIIGIFMIITPLVSALSLPMLFIGLIALLGASLIVVAGISAVRKK